MWSLKSGGGMHFDNSLVSVPYSNICYNLSTGESNDEWRALYGGVMTNMRHIRENSDSALLRGIATIIEAHAFGTGASLWGDIPYSEAGISEIEDPIFDPQVNVYNSAIALLDEGINTLNGATSEPIDEDIYFNGNKDNWIAAAYTLKARLSSSKRLFQCIISCKNGISSASGDLNCPRKCCFWRHKSFLDHTRRIKIW